MGNWCCWINWVRLFTIVANKLVVREKAEPNASRLKASQSSQSVTVAASSSTSSIHLQFPRYAFRAFVLTLLQRFRFFYRNRAVLEESERMLVQDMDRYPQFSQFEHKP